MKTSFLLANCKAENISQDLTLSDSDIVNENETPSDKLASVDSAQSSSHPERFDGDSDDSNEVNSSVSDHEDTSSSGTGSHDSDGNEDEGDHNIDGNFR
jgi:hypothetical protein